MSAIFPVGKNPLFGVAAIRAPGVVLLLAAAAMTARADWPNTNATKYYQPPNLATNSVNILAAQPPAGSPVGLPVILADDFPCTQTGYITDIHIWTSWLQDATAANLVPDVPITLGFWSDVPAAGTSPSHPGTLLWSQTFLPGGAIPGHYKKMPGPWAPSIFWDPDPFEAGNIMGNDSLVWLYNFYPDPQQGLFQQLGTASMPTNYWLSMTAGTNVVAFGWRDSPAHYGDVAVFGHLNAAGDPIGDWQELFNPLLPAAPVRLDLAFALTTSPTPPPTNPPPPTKWEQLPDYLSGFDVNATSPNVANGLLTLADDFQCTVVGPITNIQLWASYQNDAAPAPETFVVSIWTDSPKGSNGFSQPGGWLWSQTYGPNDYTFTPAGAGTEQFFDPTTANPPTPETRVWLYSFNLSPTNPFCQQGHGLIYWVSVSALAPQPAPAPIDWGWKTSTNHWGDAAVYGKLDPISHSLLVPWKPLFNPSVATVPLPMDFAFQINSGPPTTDCDPAAFGGAVEPPDTSTNGLDVWSKTPAVTGDDFLCQITGNISGITVWGSWLNDQVDTNAQFQVSLWSDVPVSPGNTPYSQPGSLLCSAVFSPPQTLGGALRYQSSLFQSNVQETFYNPSLPGTNGLIGHDTQIWRYDFFPFVPSCFVQQGDPFANGKIYWVTVSYLPGPGGPGGGASTNVFGWKTSTSHLFDAAVFGTNGTTWSPLSDPRNGASLDLAKKIWKFRVTGKNEDIYNRTGSTADGIQIVLLGTHLVTWHYDDSPPWSFMTYPTNGGDTVLQWSGRTIPPGGLTHVGYETPGTVLPPVLSMNWLNGTNILGPIVQQNYHLLGDPLLVFGNDFYPGMLLPGASSNVEYYTTPPPLDQMIVGGARNPIGTAQLSTGPVSMGGDTVMLNPQPLPPRTLYELLVVGLNDPQGEPGALDFVLLPLDAALAPAISSAAISGSGGNVVIHIDSDVGHSYQLLCAPSLVNPQWYNVGAPVIAYGSDTILTGPLSTTQNYFYRVMLLP